MSAVGAKTKGRSHEVTPEELRGLNFANPFQQAAG
jgi:hypothetical protein